MKQKTTKTEMFFRILACITFTGLVFRLIVAAQLISADPSVNDPSVVTDMATYRSISSEILKGKIPEVFYYQPFYYSVFLPMAQTIFRSVTWGTAIAQALCSAGIIWFAGLCASMLRGRRSGIFAAVIACFSTMLVFYVPYALIEIQQAFWFTLLFWFTLRGYRTGKLKFWCGAGVTLSFAILSRGNAWCFLPAVLAAMYFRQKNFDPSFSLKCRILSVILLFACILLPQIPFILRNSIKLKTFSGPSTAGPAVLALGNNPEAAAGYLEYPETYKRWFNLSEQKSVTSDIVDWAMTEPCAFLELQMRKFLLYWDGREIPNNVSLEINGKKSSFLPAAGWIPTSWILILAIASFFLLFPYSFRRKGLLLLNLFIVLYAIAAASFYILARFRVPSIGLLTISAGIFPDYLLRNVKAMR